MRFHEFGSYWDAVKDHVPKNFGRRQAYDYARKVRHERIADKTAKSHALEVAMIEKEESWYERRRPYYKVYPCVVDALCRLNLDFNCECPKVPEETICVRFAEGNEPQTKDGIKIAALLVSAMPFDTPDGERIEELAIQVTFLSNRDRYFFSFDTNIPSVTIQECMEADSPIDMRNLYTGEKKEPNVADSLVLKYKEVRSLASRIALTVCMLKDDPEVITPDVLVEHQSRYDKASEEWKRKAEKNARKRGKVGWNIGKDIEALPRIVRPYWALRHTGPNGSIPKIVPVKGYKVKADKLTHVPTGYILSDGTEVEDGKIAQNC